MRNNDEEITLKDIILKVQEYWRVLWSKKWWVIGSTIVFGLLYLGKEIKAPQEYSAEITFMVNEDNGGGLAGAAAILGQFGLGGGGGSEYNLDKIVALSKSYHIISKSLLDTAYKPILAEQTLQVYKERNDWESDSILMDGISRSSNFNKAIRKIGSFVKGGDENPGLVSCSYTGETGILELHANTINEELSYNLVHAVYEELLKFYINETVERPRQNYRILSERADSVYNRLTNLQSRIAYLEDRYQATLFRKNKVEIDRLKGEVQILGLLYGEIVKNKETADFILKSETPFFQTIDRTELPIEPQPKGKIRPLIIGGLLGGILSSMYFLIIYAYRQIMKN